MELNRAELSDICSMSATPPLHTGQKVVMEAPIRFCSGEMPVDAACKNASGLPLSIRVTPAPVAMIRGRSFINNRKNSCNDSFSF